MSVYVPGSHEPSRWFESPPHRLFRRRRLPGGEVLARLLIVHGYGDHSGRYSHLMDWLAARHVATDAFDFRGHGRSSGKRGYVSKWSEFLDDLRATMVSIAADAQADGVADRPLFVLGHSHGGLVAATAGVEGLLASPNVAGVILTAPYLRPAERLSPAWRMIAAATSLLTPSLRVSNGLSPEMMTSDTLMIEDSRQDPLLLQSATPRWYTSTLAAQARVMERTPQFTLPLLCLSGDGDSIADPQAARTFVERAGSSRKTMVLLPGQRHEILREAARETTFQTILDWIGAGIVHGRSCS